jgi:hypothetical protein
MGGVFKIFSSIFKPIVRAVRGKKKKRIIKPIVKVPERVTQSATTAARRVASLGSGYAGKTIMTTAGGIEEKARSVRTLLGS